MSGPQQRVSVFTDLPGYRAAVASLPVSTVAADAAAGAVVVLSGETGWWDGVLAAQADGAAAVVVLLHGRRPVRKSETCWTAP